MNGREDRLRRLLSERAAAVNVGDPMPGVASRRRVLRRRRQLRIGVTGVIVLALAVGTVVVVRHDDRGTTPKATTARQQSPLQLRSKLVRDTHPLVAAGDLHSLERANTATALAIYHQLATTPGNVFFSPYSIATALSMTSAGARGDTLTQMLAVLHNEIPPAKMHDAVNALNLALLRSRPEVKLVGGKPLQLELANSLWGQNGYHLEQQFLDLLARDYGAAVNTLDFQKDPAGAASAINHWVDAQTNGKIKQLFAELDPETKLVLVNAVYFKASWAMPFDASSTAPSTFRTGDQKTVEADFMHGDSPMRYSSGDGWQAVDLPYLGDASMTVIVPDAGRFADVEHRLGPRMIDEITAGLHDANVELALPKLQLTDRANLVPMLRALGMRDAFDNADFSGITGSRELAISQVVHQATITVDERGTEAAAATGISIATSGTPETHKLTVDRPYLFLIRDTKTATILFMGRVTDPTKTEAEQP